MSLPAIADQRFSNGIDPIAGSGAAIHEVNVLMATKPRIISSQSSHHVRADHHRLRQHRALEPQNMRQSRWIRPVTSDETVRLVREEGPYRTVDGVAAGVLGHVLALPFQLLRQPDVVVIHESNELASRPPDSLVAGCSTSNVHRQVDDAADSRIPVEVSARGFAGTIVDNNDFERLEGLCQNGLNRLVYILLAVAVRNDDGNVAGRRRRHRTLLRSSSHDIRPLAGMSRPLSAPACAMGEPPGRSQPTCVASSECPRWPRGGRVPAKRLTPGRMIKLAGRFFGTAAVQFSIVVMWERPMALPREAQTVYHSRSGSQDRNPVQWDQRHPSHA